MFVGPSDAFSVPVGSLENAPSLDFSPGEAAPAETRAAAFALVEQVAAHLRSVEPSSPAPYLLDRARTLATRDFLTPARRRVPGRHARDDEERRLTRYLRASLRNTVQSGEPPASISAKFTACRPRRQQSEMPRS